MSRSSRKRPSKWDLSEEQQFEVGNIPDDGWMGKPDRSFHPKESGQEWHSPELGGRSASKWSGSETNDMQRSKRSLGLPTREPLPGSRSSHRNGSVSKGGSRYMEDSLAWGEDGNSSMRMSPGLEEWRQHRSRSPKSGYSRSQRGRSRSRSWTKSRSQSWSRSPDHGYRQEPIFLERSRSRSGFSAQVCKDFAVGRCRRGSDCQLLHEGNTTYDDSWDDRHRKGGASKYPTGPMADDNSSRSGRSSYGNDFVNGKSRREASSNYDNSRMPDGFSKGSANEIFRERDNDRERDSDRRRRDASSEQVADREPRRSNIPCKFFAAGNCRNKNFCQFSHRIQSHGNSDRWSQDERYGLGQNSNDREQPWNGQKWNGMSSDSARLSPSTNTRRPRSGRWAVGQHRNDADHEWDGKKWSDTAALPESAKLTADNNRNIAVQEQRSNDWSMSDNRWGHGQNSENEMRGDPSVSHDPVKKNDKEAQPWNEDKAGSNSKDYGKWLGAMSPDWKYTLPPSNTGKEEHGHIACGSEISRLDDTSLNACKQDMSADWNRTMQTSNNNREQRLHISLAPESSNLNNTSQKDRSEDIVQEASGQVYGGVSVMQPMIGERSNYQHNQDIREGGSIGFPHDAKNAIDRPVGSRGCLGLSGHITSDQRFGHGVHSSTAFPFPVLNPVGQSQPPIPSHIQEVLLNSKDTLSAPRNSAINSDIGESKPGLPESLAQIMENGHLPRLFAVALSSQNVLSVPPPPFIKSEGSLDQLSNVQPDAAIFSQKSSSNTIGPNSLGTTSVDVKLEKASDDKHQISYSVGEPKRKSHEPDGSNKVGVEMKAEASNDSPENGPQEVTDKDGADKGKKLKEAKEIRAFKFALAEFVKDLMKPSWKDGKVGKDAYKTIVKKVVDKVTGTILGANIPQTQEKIDSYLSSSKPKLTKLVQAYVEKMQKS